MISLAVMAGPYAGAMRRSNLRDQFLHHVPMHVGQAEVAPGAAEGEFFVIETEQGQNRGMKIVHVNFVLDGLEAELIGRAVDVAAPNTASRHPHGETVMIMVPPV